MGVAVEGELGLGVAWAETRPGRPCYGGCRWGVLDGWYGGQGWEDVGVGVALEAGLGCCVEGLHNEAWH